MSAEIGFFGVVPNMRNWVSTQAKKEKWFSWENNKILFLFSFFCFCFGPKPKILRLPSDFLFLDKKNKKIEFRPKNRQSVFWGVFFGALFLELFFFLSFFLKPPN